MTLQAMRQNRVPAMRRTPRAFTLIELIAVLATVIILVALLLPAYQMVMRRVDAAKCVSNLRTYISNAGLYIAENNGEIPGASIAHPTFSDRNEWPYQLRNYPDKPTPMQPLCCPASVKSIKREGERKYPAGPGSTDWSWWYGYNTNRYFSYRSGIKNDTASGPARIGQFPTPSKTPFYMDVDMRKSSGSINAYSGEMFDGGARSNYKFWAAHSGFFNIAMLDGHVEQVEFNKEGRYHGEAAGDYPQFTWKPF